MADIEEFEYLCYKCLTDGYLDKRIKRSFPVRTCVACNRLRRSIGLTELGAMLDPLLQKYLQVAGQTPWGSSTGDPLNFWIQELLSVEPDVADILARAAADASNDYSLLQDGGEPFYDPTSDYSLVSPAQNLDLETWEEFCHNVVHTSRFFSTPALSRLETLFANLESLHTFQQKPVIRVVAPEAADFNIFRARVVDSAGACAPILSSPAVHLGPPPGSRATAGRMNPTGISVFYGGLTQDVCLAEVRPPVGGLAIIAQFELCRPVKLLDLRQLDLVYDRASLFDPMFDRIRSRGEFLRGFHSNISAPVLPHAQSLDFIPTQVVAEYLAHHHHPPLDGLLYNSSQSTEENEAVNIVLFHHAALVDTLVPGSREDSSDEVVSWIDIEDDGTIYSASRSSLEYWGSIDGHRHPIPVGPHSDLKRLPTLRVVPQSLQVLRIVGNRIESRALQLLTF